MSDNNNKRKEAFPLGLTTPQKRKRLHPKPERGPLTAQFELPHGDAGYGLEYSMERRGEEMKRIQEEQKKEQEANDAHQEQMEKYGNAFDQNNNEEYDFDDPNKQSDPNKDDPLSKLLGDGGKKKEGGFLEFFGLAGGGKSRRRRRTRRRRTRRRRGGEELGGEEREITASEIEEQANWLMFHYHRSYFCNHKMKKGHLQNDSHFDIKKGIKGIHLGAHYNKEGMSGHDASDCNKKKMMFYGIWDRFAKGFKYLINKLLDNKKITKQQEEEVLELMKPFLRDPYTKENEDEKKERLVREEKLKKEKKSLGDAVLEILNLQKEKIEGGRRSRRRRRKKRRRTKKKRRRRRGRKGKKSRRRRK